MFITNVKNNNHLKTFTKKNYDQKFACYLRIM